MNAIEILRALGACSDSIEWAEAQPDQSPDALWRACTNADWLAWYLEQIAEHNGHGSLAHRQLVSVACLCVRTFTPFWHDQDFELALTRTEQWTLDTNNPQHPNTTPLARIARNVSPRTRTQAILADHGFPNAVACAVSSPSHPQTATFAISTLCDFPRAVLSTFSLPPSFLVDQIRRAIPSPPNPRSSHRAPTPRLSFSP